MTHPWFSGTGGPGMCLEVLLGLQPSNRDIPDAGSKLRRLIGVEGNRHDQQGHYR